MARTYAAGVAVTQMPAGAPAAFTEAVEQLRHARLRPEVRLVEVPAPQRIAPHSVALSAEVDGVDGPDGPEVASGRFVLLHDPAGQEAWQGTMRVVSYVRAALEPELASDPLLSDVGWSWLTDCLEAAGADAGALGGTVTRVLSDCHGTLAERPPTVELEIRASWTADDPDGLIRGGVQAHLQGWAALLGTVAGLPPLPEGVSALRRGLR